MRLSANCLSLYANGFLCILVATMSLAEEMNTKATVTTDQLSALSMYRNLFNQHRVTQLEAVKSIQKFGDNVYRQKIVELTLEKLFAVLNQAKENLTQWGYVPGDEFPQNETIKDGLSKVLENTAMFGDFVLRLPDIVHDIYDKKKDWQLLISWCYWFSKESEVFEGANAKLLNLMAQEIQLIPKEEDYVNPFKMETQMQQKRKPKENTNTQKKTSKQKKDKRKGPRLSGTRNEL